MSPLIRTHKKACFPKVGSARAPPYLPGEGARQARMHADTHRHVRAQGSPAPESPDHRTDALLGGWSWGNESRGMETGISLFFRKELL